MYPEAYAIARITKGEKMAITPMIASGSCMGDLPAFVFASIEYSSGSSSLVSPPFLGSARATKRGWSLLFVNLCPPLACPFRTLVLLRRTDALAPGRESGTEPQPQLSLPLSLSLSLSLSLCVDAVQRLLPM